jgi:hypothetical protein
MTGYESTRRRHSASGLMAIGLATAALVATAASSLGNQSSFAAVRQATAAFHDLSAAEAAGYGPFYICTDEPGQGAMGQHFVNGALVGDAVVDPLTPEALVYEPKPGGGYRLGALEYVVFADAWDAVNADPPSLFGQPFRLITEPNRYGLPPFYELHVWIWSPNPRGIFNDWNPRVSCAHAAE